MLPTDGTGDNYGDGDGHGYGDGHGDGSGDGDGDGHGDGSGYGYGPLAYLASGLDLRSQVEWVLTTDSHNLVNRGATS